jgi:hypothetical protein
LALVSGEFSDAAGRLGLFIDHGSILLWSVVGGTSLSADGAVPSILGERDGVLLRSQRPRAGLLSFFWKRCKQFFR